MLLALPSQVKNAVCELVAEWLAGDGSSGIAACFFGALGGFAFKPDEQTALFSG